MLQLVNLHLESFEDTLDIVVIWIHTFKKTNKRFVPVRLTSKQDLSSQKNIYPRIYTDYTKK